MRTLGHLSAIGLATCLSSFLAACGGPIDGAGSGSAPGVGGTGTGSVPGAGGAAGVGGSGTGGISDPTICTPGVPQTSQLPRLTNRQYNNAVAALLGVDTLTTGTSAGKQPSDLLNPDYEGPMNSYAWSAYLNAAGVIAAEVMADPAKKANFINCDPATPGCLTTTITTFGRKAFRRPLTADDIARFEALADTDIAPTPDELAEATLLGFLASPSFIMLTELVDGAPLPEDAARPGDIKLSSYEVAARLSILLWGSIPDDELNAAADADQLTTKAQILAQATRMIALREKVGPQVAVALRHWANMDDDNSHWFSTSHDVADYPAYTATTTAALSTETDKFFEEVAFGGGSFADLFTSPVGFVNKDNAAIYGLDPADYGADFERYEFPDRPGFLTRAGFLSSYSKPKSTSPILRGAYITIKMIGVDPGPPSPNALTTAAPPGDYKTMRQYIEALTSPSDCTGCHSKFVNPPGFALETFDAIGAAQTTDPMGDPIDAVSEVTFAAGDKRTISTPADLMAGIATSQTARRNYAEKLTAFASGRAPNSNDACTVDQLETALSNDGYTVLNLLTDLTQADSLRLRTRGN